VNITDGLLVVAVDVVAAVAAEARPALSGRKQIRLLAWTLADARGAQTPMDKALAETVGKRLERQAQRVRPTLEAAAQAAAVAVEAARAAVESDPEMESKHTRQLCKADAAAFDEHERLRDEVYVGFNELNALLHPASSAEDVADSTEGQGDAPEAVAISLEEGLHSRLMGRPFDESGLLQRALDLIITLEGRLDGQSAVNASLRADLVSARCRAEEADDRAAEAERCAERAEEQRKDLERQHLELEGVLEDEIAAADMDRISLRRKISELHEEVRRLSATK
jgi:hypothetical protein